MSRNSSDNLISPKAADLLISLRDGDAALLYLYFCRHGFREPERAGRDLFMPRQRLQEACERLEMQGLMTQAGNEEPLQEQDSSADRHRGPVDRPHPPKAMTCLLIPQLMSAPAPILTVLSQLY